MKNKITKILLTCLLFHFASYNAIAQQGIVVNMTMLDGADITPNNVFKYQVINSSGRSVEAEVKGTLHYRNSSLRMNYSFMTMLSVGTNSFSKETVNSPTWTFSENALKELFFNYAKLPEGTYEYCVEVTIKPKGGEVIVGDPVDACLYKTSTDVFLIDLLEPENNAKISESYPMFSWIVNYPFASELTYKLRVAELKQGQNNANAISRNNPVYQDNKVLSTTQTYPVTAKPLEKWQPYVWTVDAYYKGILLGGAEVWKFTIVDDSILATIPVDPSYYEFADHMGDTKLYAAGILKLKYMNETPGDSLTISISGDNGVQKYVVRKPLTAGDNRMDVDLVGRGGFTHLKAYEVTIRRKDGKEFRLPVTYVNPDLIKK